MRLTAPAVIRISGLAPQLRVAAFTWQTATGVAWLEPDYLEEEPLARPAFHHFAGEVRDDTRGAVVYGEDGFLLVFDAEANAEDPSLVPPDAAAGIARMRELLAEAGTTWEDERVRMTAVLAEDLESFGGLV